MKHNELPVGEISSFHYTDGTVRYRITTDNKIFVKAEVEYGRRGLPSRLARSSEKSR